MTVRNALLALLEQGPMYGYQLRSEFERRTGATWPLNVGQVYTTLARFERDRLVESTGADEEGHVDLRRHPGAGATRSRRGSPRRSPRTQPPRDELAIKLALAVTVPGVDVGAVIQQQRSATMSALQDSPGSSAAGARASRRDLAWSLVLESLVFAAEAEIRWLDHCEARVRRAALDNPLRRGAACDAVDATP